ncbi:amino acid adenylation domain-containing protein [Colwelliaceae bacterium MEBiC 14330]
MKASPLLAIAQRLNKLDSAKQAIFRQKLAEQGINSWQLPIVATEQSKYPLSLAQQRFLVAEKMTQRSIYNLCSVIKFDNNLDLLALEKSVNHLVERHQVMNTCFLQDDKGQWYLHDIRNTQAIALTPQLLSIEDEKSWLDEQFLKEQAYQFNLEQDRPFHINIFKSDTSYYLFVTIHHVAFDAWSFDVFNQELALLYLANSQGEDISLPALSIQYKDYAQWQNQWIKSEDFIKQQDYWSKQLNNAPESLALPYDYKLTKDRSYEGQVATLALDKALSLSIREAINHNSSTLFVYLQTAFAWLLAKHCSQTDFCFGSSVANRQRPELSTMVGPLLNTLVLRHQINTKHSFEQALASFQVTANDAFEHQDYPFEQLAKLIGENEQLFRVMFIHVGLANDEHIQLGDCQGEIVTPEQNNARFDLSLRVIEHDDQSISFDLEYSTELFHCDTIKQLLNDYQGVIASILDNPQISFSQLSLASPLSQLAGTSLEHIPSSLDNKIISHADDEHAKEIALFDGETAIDYAGLNKEVALLASWLQSQGINATQTSQKRLAILMPRTSLQVTLMLAAWRAGAVCVMLDPKQPLARLNAICEDAEVALVVSDQDYGIESSKEVPLNNEILHNIKQSSASADVTLAKVACLENNAYMLYTSGSTGKPKGIVVSQQAVSHYAAAISQQYPQPQGSRWLTLATVAADLGLTSVFSALYQGQCLLLPSVDTIADPNALSQFLHNHPADCLKITPSHLNALLSVEAPKTILPKRCLFLGGEGLNPALFHKIKELNPALNIINHYGPSESTVGITAHTLDQVWSNALSAVAPLGLPLPGNTITLRNKQGDVVPRGALAELCVSSPQLAQGYWNNDKQTQQCFIGAEHDEALSGYAYYRTGDLAKINQAGLLEFIGRADDQVKRRGYRVELDEITHWLNQQDNIDNAIVLMVPVAEHKDAQQTRQQLIAWLSLTNSQDKQAEHDILSQIKAKMSKSLPDYMLPDFWQVLAQLPLNDNGKIDRKALPLPTENTAKGKQDHQSTLTPVESALAQLWRQILSVKEINADDSFFALGGDSIMSLQMIGMALKQGIKLAPAQIAQDPRLSAIANKAELLASFNEQDYQQIGLINEDGEPDNPNAKIIADVFAKVLSKDNIALDDNFFALGGDSILSLQFIALVRQQGLTISPKLLLDNPTPLTLAHVVVDNTEAKETAQDTDTKLSNTVDNTITKVDISLAQPLTPAQQRIWFIQQLEPTSTAYNLPAAFHVKGNVNPDKLLIAAKALVEKHLMLRVKYTQQAKSGVAHQQVISSYQPLTIHTKTSYDSAIENVKQLTEHCFDLSTGQVLKVDLLPIASQSNEQATEWLLVFNMHHIATDGWSMGLLIQDLLQLYQASDNITELEHKNTQLNYLDWSAYQAKQPINDKVTRYWLARLKDMPQQLALSFDKPLPNKQTYHGAIYEKNLAANTITQLEAYARELATTPFTLLLAGFQLLLWRYSAQEDFAIGIPVSGREDVASQEIVGVFINTLVNRATISADRPTEQWLADHIKSVQADLNHQQMPLEALLNRLNPERNVARPPLFQVVFNYQNDQQGNRTISLPEVSFTPLDSEDVNTKFELSFNLLKRDGLALQIEYNQSLFDQQTIEQLFTDYLSILDWLPNAKQAPLSSLVVKSSEQALALATTVNSKRIEASALTKGLSLNSEHADDFITRFENQVSLNPDNIAVFDHQGAHSYADINAQANQLAHWLCAQGVVKDQLVAFSLPRNANLLVTLLAIQKAGAAYLPLDHKQPRARLHYIVEHAKPSMLLVDAITAESFVDQAHLLTNLTDLTAVLASQPSTNIALTIDARQLAYTLYTSGSTGKPKGVEIERGNFASFLAAIELITPKYERILALTTITFDIAGLELCLPLATGKSVVIANEEQQKDNLQLAQLVTDFTVDLIQATPATWEMLVAVNNSNELVNDVFSNTHAICGGEALNSKLADKLSQYCKSVINVYGPTEATVWSSYYPLTSDINYINVPIGRPLLNNNFYVLDKQLTLVPFGVVGELYIAGSVLARGYRHAAQLTKSAFIDHPEFGRLYKTGDQVKWLTSQQLMFVGRVDFQLKHRGYRIEPGEIESALTKLPDISQAVVTMQQKMLVAHLVMIKERSDNLALSQQEVKALHEHLTALLPDYMVPQHYQCLSALPLNNNGKVDRSKLPLLVKRASTESVSKPLNKHERLLADIWAELLSVEHINKEDNFFLLGGHSLLATQLRARLNESGLNIPLKSLFEAPVLSEQAKLLTESRYKLIPLLSKQANPPELIPLSDAQKRLWFMQQLDLNNTSFNMQIAVEITGQLQAEMLKVAIETVVAEQAILKTIYIDNEGEPLQTYQPSLVVPFIEKSVELHLSQDVLESQLATAANYVFDLSSESPLRIHLYQLSSNRYIFQLIQHHIASDAWSMTLLLDQIISAYQQVSSSVATNDNQGLSGLPNTNKPSYLDYANWQNSVEIVAQQASSLEFWRQSLAGVPTVLELPTDRQRASKNQQQGDVVNLVVSKHLHAALNKLANDNKTSLFTLLLSVFGVLIHQQTKRQDIIIGADVANREHHQTQDMLGFFVNLLPLRLQPKATLRFNEFLQQIKTHCLNSFEHQAVPFDQIVETVNPERIAGMHPLIQVLFVMQNTPDTHRYESELSIAPLETKQHHAKFDCALFANADKASGELLLNWVFNCQLFDRKTIERLSQTYLYLLEQIIEQPRAPLNNLIAKDSTEQETNRSMSTATAPKKKASKLSKLNKLKKNKPQKNLVEVKPMTAERIFPLLVQCQSKSLDPLTWARQNQAQIMSWLETNAGIVFRGFNLPTPLEFEQFCLAIYPELYAQYGDLPKNEMGNKIYKSTPYPNDQMIMFHNESSHQHQWPRRQWFYCSESAEIGGATPIVDCREMYLRLPEAIREKLEQKQLCYVRNFSNLDVSWQHFFKTEQRAQVEKVCQESGIGFSWYGDDNLRITQVCPAIITHPITKEKSFFNQIQLHHFSFLEHDVKAHFLEICEQDELPRNVFYGDFSPIEQEVVDVISELYESCAVRFDWQPGDVVMLDNMLAAHARDPFEGKRKISVAMGDIYQPGASKENNTDCTPVAVKDGHSTLEDEVDNPLSTQKQQSINTKETL